VSLVFQINIETYKTGGKDKEKSVSRGSASPKSLPWGENLGANNSDFTTYTA